MTSSMAAATLLCDMIQGRDNPYAGLFSPSRLDPAALPGILTEGGQAVKSMVKRFFQIPAEAAKDIPAGHGGIVFLNGKKAGVYRDKSGRSTPWTSAAPTWAASWSGTRTRRPGTAPATAPGSTAWAGSSPGPHRQTWTPVSGPAGGLYRHQSSGLHNDRSGSEGLVLRFTNQAAALVCGSSADVRPMSLLFTAWGQRRAPPPQLRRGGGALVRLV